VPGAPAADAPVAGPRGEWLLSYVGDAFVLLAFDFAMRNDDIASLASGPVRCEVVQIGGIPAAGATIVADALGLARQRYDARPGTIYLLRPDQHVCARFRAFDLASVRAAIARATCNG
jgi:3-(3-hydroxy-phenyl)propionate hydroxylase